MTSESFKESADDTLSVKAVMVVEVFVFDSDGGLDEVGRDVFEGDGGTVLVGVDFVKKLAMAVVDFSRDRIGVFGESSGRGNVFK